MPNWSTATPTGPAGCARSIWPTAHPSMICSMRPDISLSSRVRLPGHVVGLLQPVRTSESAGCGLLRGVRRSAGAAP
ncbi:MAG: hypothetical protein V9E89_12475 [Ilumatobacteraceae bacterium]